MDIATLEAEEEALVLSEFTEETALALGERLTATARAAGHAVIVSIRTPTRTLYHAALPGSGPLNDAWARRKSNTALFFHTSSLLATLRHEAKGHTLARAGLSEADYALSGGAVPVRVRGAGVVAVCTVSGLPHLEDHALVVSALRAMV
jgi:uncharacterized protein (UPF0303 family)